MQLMLFHRWLFHVKWAGGCSEKEEELQAVKVEYFQTAGKIERMHIKDTYIVGIMSLMGDVIEVGGG